MGKEKVCFCEPELMLAAATRGGHQPRATAVFHALPSLLSLWIPFSSNKALICVPEADTSHHVAEWLA